MSKDKIERWNDVEGNLDNKELLQAFLDSNNNGFAILQLRLEPETKDERFESYEVLKNMGKEPNIDHYEVVYTSPISPAGMDKNIILNSIYIEFNMCIPDDFKGHSLSVSDVVALKLNNDVTFNYVDSFGFQKLENFILENYLKYAEMSMEDDYNMIDGIINNGKKEEPSSVLEQLKAKSVEHVSKQKTHENNIER